MEQAKMLSGGHDHAQKFLQIKQEDKFFSRLLSKESSKAEPSFRVLYYGGASGAVPFMWESQPGTPKHPLSDPSLPPLTPPPSYQSNPKSKSKQKISKPSFLSIIFPRITTKKNHVLPALSSSSVSTSCSSGSYSSSFAPMNNPFIHPRVCLSDQRSTFRFGVDDDDHGDGDARSPNSTLCFGVVFKEFWGSRSKMNVK
ncbi:hypothetical protein HYC85_000934 [Camellia sinensis]|uniref:Uncharacterized protein n=1 Tax=Camellia sinensis TaxID=4442 RepID=A0A7J7I4L2_CAMSI|nr:hypothetical protein HYC85_000934 [Camellia sinensis]